MARIRRKKALYEVMSKGRYKPNESPKLEPLRTEKVEKEITPPPMNETSAPEESVMWWWKKPKFIQINAGRIEISLPYQLVIALILGLILLILVAFRLGQIEQRIDNSAGQIQTGEETSSARHPTSDAGLNPALSEMLIPSEEKPPAAEPQGDHVIVLVQYQRMADLIPVREHFAKNGIETEIMQEGGSYFLVTKNRYQNPHRRGTDGYQVLQRIIEVGAKYKAPQGSDTFAPHLFSDAYGKKVP
jgi:hypothetical protein